MSTIKHINLTSPEAALRYLGTIPEDQELSLPDTGRKESNLWGDIVRAVTGENPRDFALQYNRYDWTAGELLAALKVENAR